MNNTEKFWDGLAKDIDPESDQLDPEQLRMVNKISYYIKSSDVVLDYGCARGGIALGLAAKAKEVHGIDISSKMITIANKRLTAREIKNVRFEHAKISDKQFQSITYDVIIALNVLHLVNDSDLVYDRLNTLLKPGGLLITLTPCLGEKRTLLSVVANPLLHLITSLGLIPPINFFKINKVESDLNQAGFRIKENKCIQENIATSLFVIAKKTGRGE